MRDGKFGKSFINEGEQHPSLNSPVGAEISNVGIKKKSAVDPNIVGKSQLLLRTLQARNVSNANQ